MTGPIARLAARLACEGFEVLVPEVYHELTGIRQYRKLYCMKATLEIQDDLYRRVKARSALEGVPLRAVAEKLFRKWLDAPDLFAPKEVEADRSKEVPAPWLAVTQPHLRPGMSHDLESIRSATEAGWMEEISSKSKSVKGRRG